MHCCTSIIYRTALLVSIFCNCQIRGQLNYDTETEPLTIFFESDHYRNKASEQGFCEQVCSSGPRTSVQKPGKCPNIGLSSASGEQLQLVGCARKNVRHECRYDSQCPRSQKCCTNSQDPCAVRRCVEPNFRLSCQDLDCDTGSVCVDRPAQAASGRDAVCVSTVERTGRCPASSGIAVFSSRRPHNCESECIFDEECSDPDNKCCQTDCGRRCLKADHRVTCQDLQCTNNEACVEYPPQNATCVDTEPRIGLCPKVGTTGASSGQYLDTCINRCQYDSECDEDKKCCNNGCALQCLPKRRPDCDTIKCKVGYKCEADHRGEPKCQPIPCQQDGEVVDIECNSCTCIQGFLLCSQEDCPPVKPGFCPRLVRGYRGLCSENCSSDYECPGDEKCCNTGCGRSCKQSTPTIVHPCKTVRFRCGDNTRCAATRGLCVPGKPCPLVPLCVSRRVPFCESCSEGKVCILQKRPCPQGHCQRQPICVQLYSDDTPFEENEQIEENVIARQQRERDNLV